MRNRVHIFMRNTLRIKPSCSVQIVLLKTLLFVSVLACCLSLFSLLQEQSTKPEESPGFQYDYADMQLDIQIAPFDDLQPPVFDADALRAQNSDFRGWLQIPDTTISLPVVQGTDNSFYLKHSFSREYSGFGCLFLDHRTTKEDRSLVIHGHNMGLNRTEMFSSLVHYQDPEYAKAHDTIFYCDPERVGEERYTVFAVLNLDIHNSDGFAYRQQQFADDAAFQAFVSYLKDHSIYKSDVVPDGNLLILSTCNRAYGDSNRLLICAGKNKSEDSQ